MGFAGKTVFAFWWLMVVPWGAGTLFFKKEKKIHHGRSFVIGYLFLFFMMELLTLPMIPAGFPLHILSICYGVIGGGAAMIGIWRMSRRKKEEMVMQEMAMREEKNGGSREKSTWLLIAFLLIAAQILVSSLLAHMDADDAFYVGMATTAEHTDTIFSVNPYTGNPYKNLPSRYVLSPFPIFLAMISQLCGGLHPAILAHVIFPAVFLILSYVVLYQFAGLFFPEDADARGIFLILGCVLTWFSGFSVYTSGNFQMIRIWQGKGLLAAALLPCTIWLCMKNVMKKEPELPWLFLLLANGACCLVSSMGILLSPVVVGLFAVMGALRFHDAKRMIKCILCCIPSAVLGVIYMVIR